jgi:hypothetical protein
MSKILTFVLFFAIVVLGFVSCSSDKNANEVRDRVNKLVKHNNNNNKNKHAVHKHGTLQSVVSNPEVIDQIKLQMNCTQCSNGEDCCNDGPNTTAECCGKGSFCCDSNSLVAPLCCQDQLCLDASTELCCEDKKNGAVGCESALTQCCPPAPEYDLPSRCCPNWYICCNISTRYGCCDPVSGKPIEETDDFQIAHALLLEPTWISNMKFDATTINLASGNYTQRRITGFKTWGETQRTFMYDRIHDQFFLLQANFTAPPTPGDDPRRAIHLFTIDAVTGDVSVKLVTGADDLVTGYHFVPEQNTIVMATVYYTSNSQTEAGFKFYHVNPQTAQATLVTQHKTTLEAAGKYDGWFHEVSPDMKFAFRLGFEHILTQQNFGLGISDLSKNPVQSKWISLPYPTDHSQFKTLTMIDSASPTVKAHFPEFVSSSNNELENIFFLSLAPSYNSTRYGDLDLYLWPLQNPSSMKSIAKFKNAHVTPQFGPIQECVSADGSRYAALVVCDDPISDNDDVWCLATAQTAANTTTSGFEFELNPVLLAETVSAAGLGIPETTKKFFHGLRKN